MNNIEKVLGIAAAGAITTAGITGLPQEKAEAQYYNRPHRQEIYRRPYYNPSEHERIRTFRQESIPRNPNYNNNHPNQIYNFPRPN
jgi:hypothetical protein